MNWWHYLLLVNIYLVLFYGFYALLLCKETFFQLNRVYLVSAALLSFFIPVIQADWVQHLFITEQVRYSIYGGGATIYTFQPIQHTQLTIGQLFSYLYVSGIAFLSIRFIFQLIRVKQMLHNPEPSAAYSFFKKISLGENFTKQETIIAHEEVHARQWHSLDVIIIEAVMIINWFNPIVYLYRFAIKHIHEFIADQQALKIGVNKAEYALLLLSQTFNAPSHQLVNPFYNHSLLKKRIIMLQKSKSQRIVLFKYVLSAPLFGLMLILSSATVNNSKAVTVIHLHANKLFHESAINVVTNNGEIPEQPLTSNVNASSTPANQVKSAFTNIEKPTRADTTADKIFESVETEPSFPGGINAFYNFLSKTIRYPKEARDYNITGRVYVVFIVEKDGSISNIKAVRGPGHGLNEEAVSAMGQSPRWNPGIQNGRTVRVQYTVPVNFTLSGTVPDKPTPAYTLTQGPAFAGKPTLTSKYPGESVYESVETEPNFPGGIQKFYDYLGKTIKYPAEMREKKIQGKAFVQFVVETDGSLSNIKSLRDPGYGSGEESVRAISGSPKWNPGIQNGKAVRVQYTVPVNFTLNNGIVTQPLPTISIQEFKEKQLAFNGPNKPIVIVDGKEVDNINIVSPEDMESITILKDVAAKNLYGDRGNNGVILIKTKSKPAPPAPIKSKDN